MRVDLRSFGIKYREFRDSENPPILHRKELFVPIDYPDRNAFAELTTVETVEGLLTDSSDIGLQKQWNDRLRQKGLQVRGHTVLPNCDP